MAEYIFVFAWNPLLSLAEAVSYFAARGIRFELRHRVSNSAIFSFDSDIDAGQLLSSLGGTLKIGEVICMTDDAGLASQLDKVPFEEAERFKYGISAFGQAEQCLRLVSIMHGHLKLRLKSEGYKAQYRGYSESRMKLQQALVEQSKLDVEILAVIDGQNYYLGRVLAVSDFSGRRKRDKKRPVQRPSLSISPRMSEILINLSGAKPDEQLLDPFCGVGTILAEAAVQGIQAVGVDIDRAAVEGAKQNLAWLAKEYHLPESIIGQLRCGDTRKLSRCLQKESIDAVATEPHLGPALKHLPSAGEARKIIGEAEELYERSLREIKQVLKPGKKVAITAPRIKTREGRLSIDMQRICRKAGLRIVNPLEGAINASMPFVDARARNKVEREIYVLEK